ncbi:uncharacterized protein LOC126686614 [Mercurialis annua]|uniref:uncharacterized protein LOC126686614 n=1 Tax=Mercurialis annua TaxID=3986 RepID=UPI00215F542D|nr:uncharacterized protein LOC126686614 [Mercurialis annua]
MPVDVVLRLAYNMLSDYQLNNAGGKEKSKSNNAVWNRPRKGWFKINTDAGRNHQNKWGLGFVSRDCDGEVVNAGNKVLKTNVSILEAEAEALLWGLSIAEDCSLMKVVVEKGSSGE